MKHWQTIMALAFIYSLSLNACSPIKPDSPNEDTLGTPSSNRLFTPIPIESSLTPSPKPTHTQTPTFQTTSAPEPTATLNGREIQIEHAKDFGIDCDIYDAIISPKSNWASVACESDKNQKLIVKNRTGKVYVLQLTDFLPNEFKDLDGGQGNLFPIEWTNDEQFLFFYPMINVSGWGPCYLGYRSLGLFRLSLADGTVTTVLPSQGDLVWYDFSFSPNGRYLAYANEKPHVLDLRTGENYSIKVSEEISGDLVWSPDSKTLAFVSCHSDDPNATFGNSTLRLFSLSTKQQRIILQTKSESIQISTGYENSYFEIEVGFQLPNQLLYDRRYSLYYWEQDLLITATPVP